MLEEIFNIIKYESESTYVDFKLQEYPLGNHPKKNEILKDISAMANHPSNNPKYILIGIKEKNGMAAEFIDIDNPTDQAKYQQFIEDNIEPRINFQYIPFEYEGNKLAAFIITGNHQRPYLFKKDIKKITDQALEFKIGDGFIRTGTSTRKLKRTDFEEIYAKRFESKDRKSDLKINPILSIVPHLHVLMIDFSIENLSSKSIGFDAEMKLFHGKGIRIKKRFDLEHGNSEGGLSSIYPQYFKPEIDPTIFDLEISKKNNYTKISRLKRINEEYSVKISQKDKIENIFFEEILVDNFTSDPGDSLVSAEIILRSDDFKDGPLIERFEL